MSLLQSPAQSILLIIPYLLSQTLKIKTSNEKNKLFWSWKWKQNDWQIERLHYAIYGIFTWTGLILNIVLISCSG